MHKKSSNKESGDTKRIEVTINSLLFSKVQNWSNVAIGNRQDYLKYF